MATTGEPFGLFWDSENGDRTYSAASFEYWLKKFFTSGVFNGDLQVLASSGMTLEIQPGYANADGKVKFWNGAFNLTLNAANSTYPRIDTIVITRDNVNRQIVCEVVTGSYSGDTPQPTAPVRNSEIYQLVLAQIYVGAGVTGITQANITDTRPDTTLCGWITGTVEELDFSQFTAQFEQYFREFKADAEGDYESWFNEVQSEQIADKAAWDAWYAALQEELHNLPADSAEYLQIQIDELKESGLSGSIFKITTINASLEGKTVTVSNADNTEVKTGTFDSNLECMIYGMKSVGEITITSTDGIQTATRVVSIPYFGNYTFPIAFWAATVNIQGDTNLYGATITVKDSDDLTVGTVVLSSVDGTGTFTATKADTYTFNFTYQGTSYSQELAVTEETTYSINLSAGFSWQTWVDTASELDSSDYNSLDEVLEDKLAVRELFLEHACVDYMASVAASNTDLETVIENDLCAKWINNSDYALDFLYANEVIADLMDEADKYFYGEWVITDATTTPPTWGPKGNVPIMTANAAPYGEAICGNNGSNSKGYLAFDRDITTKPDPAYNSDGTTELSFFQYKFVNPTCVKRVKVTNWLGESGKAGYTFKIQYSNDGTNFTDITSSDYDLTNVGHLESAYFDVDNDVYALYWRLQFVTTQNNKKAFISELQFYGRELKVSVPTMTSNTAPFGEVSADSVYNNLYPYYAFDNADITNTSNKFNANNSNGYLQYEFSSKVSIRFMAAHANTATSLRLHDYQVEASNDGVAFETIASGSNVTEYLYKDIPQNEGYKIWRLHNVAGNTNTFSLYYLQFYGLDYSEKEFEAGTTKKWLYDHGVELEEMTLVKGSGTGNQYTKEESQIYLVSGSANGSTTNFSALLSDAIDLTSYSLYRMRNGDKIGTNDNTGMQVISSLSKYPDGGSYSDSYTVASVNPMQDGNMPNNHAVDVSSVTGTNYLAVDVAYRPNAALTITELWLE